MKSRYRLSDLTWEEITSLAQNDKAVVVIPVGSTEQHGRHLPMQTDTRIVGEIAERAVSKARSAVPVLLVPTIGIGCSQHHMEFPGTLSLKEETFIQVITEVGLCIVHHGFRRLLFLNGHGGNEGPLQVAVNKIRHIAGNRVICTTVMYFQFIQESLKELQQSESGGICHAGEFETSAILALDRSLVNMKRAEKFLPKWTTSYFRPDLFGEGKVKLGFHVKDFSDSGVLGDPLVATAEAGKNFLIAAENEVAEFIKVLSDWEFSNLYEQE
jgi:creatinine amidohydrolase